MATRTLPAPSRHTLICAWCAEQLPGLPELFTFTDIGVLLEHTETHLRMTRYRPE